MYDWVFDAALILAACVAIVLVGLGSVFGFTYHSKRRRRHRRRRQSKSHRIIDIVRKDPDPGAEAAPTEAEPGASQGPR